MLTKMIFPAALMAGILFSCAPAKKTTQAPKPEKIALLAEDQDSIEYELLIIDAGFDTWLQTNRKPKWYYSNDYLATWNYQYVLAWNERARNPEFWNRYPDHPFILEIDYRPNIDYGLELNYKLYHYFKYIEKTWGKILTYERHI
jgi:hypothetical protein